MVPLFVPNLNPWIGSPLYCSILSLYHGSFNVSIGLDEASCAGLWPPPILRHASFRIAFVADRRSGAELSHPNFYHLNSGLTRTRRRVLSELRRQR